MSLLGNLLGAGGTGTAVGGNPTVDANAAELTKRFQASALRLINRAIKTPNATWEVVPNDTTPDVDEEWNVEPPSVTAYNIKILLFPSSREDREFLRYINGTAVNTGDLFGIMTKQLFTPSLKDTLLWQGKRLQVSSIDPIQPIDLPIVYLIEFLK